MNIPVLTCLLKPVSCCRRDLWTARLRAKRASSYLASAVGFVACLSSIAVAQQFREVSSEVGLIMEATKSYGNPIWGDMNNDGFLDLIVPTHGLTFSGGPFVYLNNGANTFTDIRTTCGIGEAPQLDSTDWHGLSFGDYDGDGNLDLYIAEGAKRGTEMKRDLLFRGNGDGTFEYVSDVAGIETSTNRGRCGFWFDYDNDGKLDLFVKNFDSVNRLYRNNGNGTFTQIPGAAGLETATNGINDGSICSFADYDNDGLMDVAITGDGQTEALYRNQGGTFVDVTVAAGLIPLPGGRGIAWGDYNNDGLLDLYLTRTLHRNETSSARLYRNNGDGTFTNVTEEAGLTTGAVTYGAVWGDYDNDGFLDLFVTNEGDLGVGNANFLYHNNGNGTFTDVAAQEGLQLEDNTSEHKCAAWVDYDNDGSLDLIIKDGVGDEGSHGPNSIGFHRLFKNNGNSNHFIKVKLVGTQSNRDGIGAIVTLKNGRRMSFRQNNGGGGGEYTSQGSEPLHFGIGAATKSNVVVKWPSGIIDLLRSVPANSTITVVEGSAAQPR